MGILTILLIFLFVAALIYVLMHWGPNLDPFMRNVIYAAVVIVILYVILSLLGLAPALTR